MLPSKADIILVRNDPRDEPEAAYSKIDYEGRVAYFCSKRCREEFKKNPKKYLLKIKKQEKQIIEKLKNTLPKNMV